MKWDIDKAYGVMWIGGEGAKSLCGSMKEKVGINFVRHLCYVHDHIFEWCTTEKENKTVGDFLVNKFKNNKFASRFERDYRNFDKKSIKKLNELDKIEFSRLNNNKLFEILKKATDIYIENFDFGFIIEPMDFVMPNLITKKLKQYNYSIEEISDILTIADISFLNIELQELIEITKNSRLKQGKLLKQHAYKYRWIQSAHLGREDIPMSYFKKRLVKIKKENADNELKKLKNFRNYIKKRKNEIISKKPIDQELKKLLDVIDLIAPLHDIRKELFLRSIYTIDTARAEIARRFNYTKEELTPFIVEDLLKLNKGEKIDKNYAKQLSKESLLMIDTKKKVWRYYFGKEARTIFNKETAVRMQKISEFKGMVAAKGRAIGVVKIVHGAKDMSKMKKGNIIVSSMTKPEFIGAIKKASAIITDEGGVTCHAAIIARELNIPCIIGTKIATKILKDDDRVEVNANHGVVKILQHAKKGLNFTI